MRRIKKNSAPVWLEDWKKDFESKQARKASYKKDFPNEEKRKLRKSLLIEQGYICCYCMRRIDIENSHVEHFWPKSVFTDKDMEYSNVLASCNGNTDDEDNCGHKKEDWYDNRMVIPTDVSIETMFHYTVGGHIHPVKNAMRDVAVKMIQNLGLDSYHLVRSRRKAIEASEVFDENDYSTDEIRDIIACYDSMEDGKYHEFCNVIIDVLKSAI